MAYTASVTRSGRTARSSPPRYARSTRPPPSAAEQALEAFADSEVGRRAPAVVDVWRRAWPELVPFLGLPPEIRRVVYTTNVVESINYQLRKVSKTRGQFPTDDAVYKILYLAVCDIETRDTSWGGGARKKSILSRGANNPRSH